MDLEFAFSNSLKKSQPCLNSRIIDNLLSAAVDKHTLFTFYLVFKFFPLAAHNTSHRIVNRPPSQKSLYNAQSFNLFQRPIWFPKNVGQKRNLGQGVIKLHKMTSYADAVYQGTATMNREVKRTGWPIWRHQQPSEEFVVEEHSCSHSD
ncbi:uncharacterized protein LOC108095381 [Drosophila ficusphila]|uniref:uncharacterized protein LOC108095381 n=1 Tax=Drosophila ficusphila TaxID=30025 RepID=UPI0007E89C40|nr:uncharacterized protein LOC108095381 [Drosophila ficusphila]